ncbi:MAG TPA: RT0821/Lpp0805 family surface protein [Xanthobacteraceae bacterium]|nr:RT0821/Lpp0805 family surface protein [Xanthobacteraceae bacterium]
MLQETIRSSSHSYHGSRRCGLIALSFAAIMLGGCSSSLPSMFGDSGKSTQVARSENVKPEPNVTGSLSLANSAKSTMSPLDWNIAKSALRESLGRAEAGASQPWENPTSGARGTVTPVAAIYEKNGFACRNFIVSHVRESKESWFEGTACRVHRGQWDVTTTRPLEKS